MADALTKKEASSADFATTKVFVVPPMYVYEVVWADILGTIFVRKINSNSNSGMGNAPCTYVINLD